LTPATATGPSMMYYEFVGKVMNVRERRRRCSSESEIRFGDGGVVGG
jgi:hypothetical protein